MLRTSILGAAVAVLMLSAGAPVLAQSGGPAVSGVNGKLGVGGGGFDDNEFGFVEGALSVPLGSSFGFQVDGIAGLTDDGGIYGTAGHLFWRDPSMGLVGLYGGLTHVDDTARDYTHHVFGAEAELYVDRVSIEALIGYSTGGRVDDDVLFIGDLAYYVTDDVRLAAGARYIEEDVLGAGGMEVQFGQSGAALFAEGRYHDDDRWQAFAGFRFYFGDGKSLIRRHREDDPKTRGTEFLFEVKERPSVVEDDEEFQDNPDIILTRG